MDEPSDWPRLLDPMLALLAKNLAAIDHRNRLLAAAANAPHQSWRQALAHNGDRLAGWDHHREQIARLAQQTEDALAAVDGDLAHWLTRFEETRQQLADALSGRL